ncbi:hypothetical protein BKA63DRAFT_505252 [Paraphoma chrysanthemicola]|nr:hypothetical protein BKA63DRAFT_505252 [Paraphoma chrysanthemicola]
MVRLHELPDDILITIFTCCDLDTIFAARLTCITFSIVISTYIKTIAPKAARNTYPSCEILLKPPEDEYGLKWLRSLVPAHLASVALDKDKLRRYPYINSGYPYGIPCESDCAEAIYWRASVANGWRVLRSLYLISKEVYAKSDDELKRPNTLRRASSGVRGSRFWQAISCPYPGCTEHGMKHVFEVKPRRNSAEPVEGQAIERIRNRESIILERRLAFIDQLPTQDLLSYVYLWRLLLWTFRPYRKPGVIEYEQPEYLPASNAAPHASPSSIIHDISQGCSWLNWYILHIGASPFIQQWSIPTSDSTPPNRNLIRNMIWEGRAARAPHQIEVEREYICKFEFALRKRCLSSERLKRLEAEIHRGRSIRTISLDCIPWAYDQHYMIARPKSDFPWYNDGDWYWIHGDYHFKITTADPRPRVWDSFMSGRFGRAGEYDEEDVEEAKGPLSKVEYLVYLGTESAGKLWPAAGVGASEFAF